LDQGFNKRSLEKIKKESASNFGKLYNEVIKETREKYFNNNYKEILVKEFENI
jgi:hypothetical protein